MYLKSLEQAKLIEREDQIIARELEEARVNKFKDQAERQRKKIQQLKTDKEQEALYEEAIAQQQHDEMDFGPAESTPEKAEQSRASAQKLTADALSGLDMNVGPTVPASGSK